MKTSIFIRTFSGDADWNELSFPSIVKFCKGFSEVVVACPISDIHVISPQARKHGFEIVGIEPYRQSGYLCQQITKLHADQYCKGDIIVHVDSDCVWKRETTPADLLHGSLPIIHMTPYISLGGSVPWKPITEKFMKRPVEFEYMRRHPFAYHRNLYGFVRSYSRINHFQNITDYVMTQPGKAFSEFNVLGAFAHTFQPDQYHFLDTNKQALEPERIRQFWSWSRVNDDVRKEVEELLK